MKKCFKCGEEKERSEFYTHGKMSDGLLGKCKQCTRVDSETRRLEKEKDPLWRVLELERHRKKSAKARAEGKIPNRSIRSAFNWMKRNPEKRNAHTMIGNA